MCRDCWDLLVDPWWQESLSHLVLTPTSGQIIDDRANTVPYPIFPYLLLTNITVGGWPATVTCEEGLLQPLTVPCNGECNFWPLVLMNLETPMVWNYLMWNVIVVTSVSLRRRCALVDRCVTIVVMSGCVQKTGGGMRVSSVLTMLTVPQPTAAVAAISPANVSLLRRSATVYITTALTAVTKMCLETERKVRQK